MTTAGEIGKARGGGGSRGNRRTLGDSAQLLVSGDSRRSHSPAPTKIEKKRIESEERTRRPALPGHFSNGRIHHPNPVTQETGYLRRTCALPALVMLPRETFSELLCSLGTIPRYAISCRGEVKRSMPCSSATIVIAVTVLMPRKQTSAPTAIE